MTSGIFFPRIFFFFFFFLGGVGGGRGEGGGGRGTAPGGPLEGAMAIGRHSYV